MAVVLVDLSEASNLKKLLRKESFYDKSRKCRLTSANKSILALPVTNSFYEHLSQKFDQTRDQESTIWNGIQISLSDEQLDENLKVTLREPLKICEHNFKNKNTWFDELRDDLPKLYEKYDDLLLISEQFLNHNFWRDSDNLKILAESFKCNRIAKKRSISNDTVRTPQVTMLLGNNGLVKHVDNKIIYQHNVLKCMYSPGNITEKIRISKMDCRGEVVVDLYAGIGYFTLPYLVHSKASHVYACELNPNAVEALKTNLMLNRVQDRCTVLEGDNIETCPRDIADRVNLGLIPSSRRAWKVACAALKTSVGGVLHIHENVTDDDKMMKNDDNNNNEKACDNVQDCNDEYSYHKNEKADNDNNNNNNNNPTNKTRKSTWNDWANNVCTEIRNILRDLHKTTNWKCSVKDINHIKSYAPHIDHMVVDIECRPEPIS